MRPSRPWEVSYDDDFEEDEDEDDDDPDEDEDDEEEDEEVWQVRRYGAGLS